MRTTHTYAVLEVSKATFDDVAARIKAAYPQDSKDWQHYFDEDSEGPLIVLGEVALRAEATAPPARVSAQPTRLVPGLPARIPHSALP